MTEKHQDMTEQPQRLAKVLGQPFQELPEDLYIPPDALEVFLEAFEGPLDLLLYLIRKQNMDILNIPIAQITQQYISYIEMMDALRLELAAEYLVMAALLAEIKSRMLLPRQTEEEDEEDDPRAYLIRKLQEYEATCATGLATDETSADGNIGVEELQERMGRGDRPVLLDVRSPQEWEICRLEGAGLIPLQDLSERLCELDPESEIVVYCHVGIRSGLAVSLLRRRGFSRARNLVGGIDAWATRVDPSTPRY